MGVFEDVRQEILTMVKIESVSDLMVGCGVAVLTIDSPPANALSAAVRESVAPTRARSITPKEQRCLRTQFQRPFRGLESSPARLKTL